MNRQTRMGQKRTKHTWPWCVVYLYTDKEIFECTSILPDACIYLSMFTMFCSLTILSVCNWRVNIYIWKMIDQIIFPWKLHSDDWKSMRYIIKKCWRHFWRRVSTITSFDHYVGNVMTRLIYIKLKLVTMRSSHCF
jgi:hypothetical protein